MVALESVHDCSATAIKDGGDDPDITNGVRFSVALSLTTDLSSGCDYHLAIGKGTATLHCIEGVGLCTRDGLPCEKGKWAINPVPLQMITENLQRLGFGEIEEAVQFNIFVENGEEVGRKTLNPRLGIIGGISILGTTGLVRPYSHDAYIDTIRMLVGASVKMEKRELIFATGTRTAKTARDQFPDIAEEQVILIGDYIAEALQSAELSGIERVTVACMPGKLNKYASGYANTHAHKTEQNLRTISEIARERYPSARVIATDCPSVREALHGFTHKEMCHILNILKQSALHQLQQHAPRLDITILLCDFNGEVIR